MSEPEERSDLPGGGNENTLNMSNSSSVADASGDSDNNNSFLGKVKTSVSNILPTSLTKWFSPATRASNQNDSLNGSDGGGIALKRTRSECNAPTLQSFSPQFVRQPARVMRNANESPALRRPITLHMYDDSNYEDAVGEECGEDVNIGEDDDDSNSEGEDDGIDANRNTRGSHPPTKRVCLGYDTRASRILSRQPLVASTPTVNTNAVRSLQHGALQRKSTVRQAKNDILLQKRRLRESEPAFDFFPDTSANQNVSLDIIDFVPIPLDNSHSLDTHNNSRRNLNIPTISSESKASPSFSGLVNLKRQSLGTVKEEVASTGVRPRRTSTTIYEAANNRSLLNTISEQEGDEHRTDKTINGREPQFDGEDVQDFDSGEACDDANESSNLNEQQSSTANVHRGSVTDSRIGFYNNSVSHSRTSSFGNGLNFNGHLEGPKSLFSTIQGRPTFNNTFNNSTLSLNSLNRRHFNASIYGSTSALSDSRLINISSSFYPGKTTYGGASAYSKYANGAAPGCSRPAFRLTPTLMRPNSSLSTRSSSNNSLGHGYATADTNPGMSSTAKRIFELMNNFSTPLSDAKKMANSHLGALRNSRRLTDADIESSRAIQLRNVQKPYSRPPVTLRPKDSPANNGQGPPTRELQVPAISQLLQLKKLRNSTEGSRALASRSNQPTLPLALSTIKKKTTAGAPKTVIATSDVAEKQRSALPAFENGAKGPPPLGYGSTDSLIQANHINKMKTKVNPLSSRISKVVEDELPQPVNLPNIAFPLMKEVPKFDIALPKASSSNATAADGKKPVQSSPPSSCSLEPPPNKTKKTNEASSVFASASHQKAATAAADQIQFVFSEPTSVSKIENLSPNPGKFKFCPPNFIRENEKLGPKKIEQAVSLPGPALKTGSVLDILSKPIEVPQKPQVKDSSAKNAFLPSTSPAASSAGGSASFGNQFKKVAGEWECDTCMIRNKVEATKCVACETPNKKTSMPPPTKPLASVASAPATASSFGDAFKPKSGNWECPTCMISNKPDALQCVACETTKPGSTAAASKAAVPLSLSGFKPKSDNWECPTCLISNKKDASQCVACETRKPGEAAGNGASSKPAGGFTFGFASSASSTPLTTSNVTSTADASFQSLAAAQKTSTWECGVCMTRNNASFSKCLCCEEPKPGSNQVSESVPKFSFGTTAASKFSFGFKPGQQEQQLQKAAASEKNSATTSVTKGGFTFGLNTANKVTTASTSTTSGFTFGFSNAQNTAPAKDTTDTAKFESVKPPAEPSKDQAVSKTADSTVTTISSANTMPLTSLPSLVTSTTTTTKPTFSFGSTENKFSFGIPKPTSAESSSSAAKNASTPQTSTQSDSHSASARATPPKVSFATTTSSPALSFAAPIASTSAAAPATFSFGSTVAASSAIKTGGFIFGAVSTTASSTKENATAESTTAKTRSFGAASLAPAATNPLAGGSFTFGQPAGSSSTAALQPPSFGATPSFGSPSSILGAAASANSSSSTSTAADKGNASATSSKPVLFGNVSTTGIAPSTSSTMTAGSFGFPSPSGTTNLFGSAAAPATSQSDKPTASATPIFGSNISAPASKPIGSMASSTPFVFGSSAAMTGASATVATTTTASATWPQNNFLFGNTTAPTTANAQSQQQQQSSSIFGSGASGGLGAGNVPSTAFGSSNVSSSSAAFGARAATAASSNSASLFGGNSSTSSTFGSSSGLSATNPAPPPSYSSTPAFGSFGSSGPVAQAPSIASNPLASGTAAASTSSTPFVFGSQQTQQQQQNNNTGFNFSANAATGKPAFNFTQSNQPAFDFTGGAAESLQAKPFQFGAINATNTNPPVFAFGSAPSGETSANAPFQFNAGTSPAANIFAPLPTSTATAAQIARRKIRQPMRRITPR